MRSLISVTACVLIAGCSSNPTKELTIDPTLSPFYLPDSVISQNINDVASLYEAWITPLKDSTNKGVIKFENEEKLTLALSAIQQGFERFCTVSDGRSSPVKKWFGNGYSCTKADGEFIGTFSTAIRRGNELYVYRETPQDAAKLDLERRDFEKRKNHNGPTGEVLTNEGRFPFGRIGDLVERHVVEVETRGKEKTYIPIEKISKIEFLAACCDLEVTLRDDSKLSVNNLSLKQRISIDSASDYGIGQWGFPMVMFDAESGQPYTKIFSNFEGIKSIQFHEESIWQNLRGGTIKSTFDPSSATSLALYARELSLKADKLYNEAETEGWLSLLSSGELTPRLFDYLSRQLVSLTMSTECRQSAVTGITDTESLQRCHLAAREFVLIVHDGYSLVTDITPLSSIIVLEKMKRDKGYGN